MQTAEPAGKAHGWWRNAKRTPLLIVGRVALCLSAPKLDLGPRVLAAVESAQATLVWLALLFESMSYLSRWAMQRVALHATSLIAGATTQLARAAVGSVVPCWPRYGPPESYGWREL
jgi:hypothetical protein